MIALTGTKYRGFNRQGLGSLDPTGWLAYLDDQWIPFNASTAKPLNQIGSIADAAAYAAWAFHQDVANGRVAGLEAQTLWGRAAAINLMAYNTARVDSRPIADVVAMLKEAAVLEQRASASAGGHGFSGAGLSGAAIIGMSGGSALGDPIPGETFTINDATDLRSDVVGNTAVVRQVFLALQQAINGYASHFGVSDLGLPTLEDGVLTGLTLDAWNSVLSDMARRGQGYSEHIVNSTSDLATNALDLLNHSALAPFNPLASAGKKSHKALWIALGVLGVGAVGVTAVVLARRSGNRALHPRYA